MNYANQTHLLIVDKMQCFVYGYNCEVKTAFWALVVFFLFVGFQLCRCLYLYFRLDQILSAFQPTQQPHSENHNWSTQQIFRNTKFRTCFHSFYSFVFELRTQFCLHCNIDFCRVSKTTPSWHLTMHATMYFRLFSRSLYLDQKFCKRSRDISCFVFAKSLSSFQCWKQELISVRPQSSYHHSIRQPNLPLPCTRYNEEHTNTVYSFYVWLDK